MNKSAPWRRLIALLIWFAILVWALYSFLLGDWSGLRGIAIGAIMGLAIILVMYPIRVKQMLLTIFSSYDHRSGTPDQFPNLDLPELERLTAEWELLGFVQRGDSEGYSANPKLGNWFSRVFENEGEGAIVEVMQQFTPTKALPLSSSVVSLWGQSNQVQSDRLELESRAEAIPPIASPLPPSAQAPKPISDHLNFLSSSTHNRSPNRYFRVMRHPRVLGARLEPTLSPEQMWQFHQKRVALIDARLGTPALHGDLTPLLRAHGRVLNDILVRRLRKTPALKLAMYSLNRKPPSPVYDGELAPLEP